MLAMPYKEKPIKKIYWTAAAVGKQIGVYPATVTYWAKKFAKHIKPKRSKDGKRLYRERDIEILKEIHQLRVVKKSHTIEGVRQYLKDNY